MRNRYAGLLVVLGLSMLTVGCYNNPDLASRPPGSGAKDIHSGPQVGPGTTAGGSTAGPQPAKASHTEAAKPENHEEGAPASSKQEHSAKPPQH